MSFSTTPPSPERTDFLPVYEQYRAFMYDLNKERRAPEGLPVLDFESFTVWWESLDNNTRQTCAEDFAKGYVRVIEEGEKEVAQVIAGYDAEGEDLFPNR